MRDISKEKFIEDGKPTHCRECSSPLRMRTGVIWTPNDVVKYKKYVMHRCPYIYNMQNPEEHSYYRWHETATPEDMQK